MRRTPKQWKRKEDLLVEVNAMSVEPVLAAVTLDHELIAIVGLKTQAVQLLLFLGALKEGEGGEKTNTCGR